MVSRLPWPVEWGVRHTVMSATLVVAVRRRRSYTKSTVTVLTIINIYLHKETLCLHDSIIMNTNCTKESPMDIDRWII